MKIDEKEQAVLGFVLKAALPFLNEKDSRKFLGTVADYFGYGGVSMVSNLTGVSRTTIVTGSKDASADAEADSQSGDSRIRKEGGGRKSATEKNPELPEAIESILSEKAPGGPFRVLRWQTASLRVIADALMDGHGIDVSHITVSRELDGLGYIRHRRCSLAGLPGPDVRTQFEFIDGKAGRFLDEGEPVISVDVPKEETVCDSEMSELSTLAPYGVYAPSGDRAFVNLGTALPDSSNFTAESIFRWWRSVGRNTFPNAKKIYVVTDGGGDGEGREGAWKYELQNLAKKTGLEIHVSHYPSVACKWCETEHSLFCFVSKTAKGERIADVKSVVGLVSSQEANGIEVRCEADETPYESKRETGDKEFDSVNFESCDRYGMWNYVARPCEI